MKRRESKRLDFGKYHFDCKLFNGYKPCHPGWVCEGCEVYEPMGVRILLINLGAGGDVLRTTAILPAIRRKYPDSFLTWLTDEGNLPVLQGNPLVDRLVPYGSETLASLLEEEFDVLLNVDKAVRAATLTNKIRSGQKFGFGLWRTGVIYPLRPAAIELFDLGVNDAFRFYKNRKPLQQLFAEALELDYRGEEYTLSLSPEEEAFAKEYRGEIGVREGERLIGVNTGCSDRIPYRRFIFEKHVELIQRLKRDYPEAKIALLGGREDTETHNRLKEKLGDCVIATPTTLGLRKGICFIKVCDLVITGDSVGLHIAIALKKPVVVWFGPTSEHEIDLYGRGMKLVTQLTCHPCWKHFCDFAVKCNEVVEIDKICDAVRRS